MRTNEELAQLAKAGEPGAMAELWEQVYWLIYKMLGKYFPFCPRCGLEPEDLIQSAYLGFHKAVEGYDPARGLKFCTYLTRAISNSSREVLGFKKGRSIPPPFVKSLDEPLPGVEDDGITLGDSIPDEQASADMEQVQEDWQRCQLRERLKNCLAQCPADQAAILRARYVDGKTRQRIADETGIKYDRVKRLEERGLLQLRRPQQTRQLRPFLYYDCLEGTGWQSFKNRGYVSRVEVLAGTW